VHSQPSIKTETEKISMLRGGCHWQNFPVGVRIAPAFFKVIGEN
jgi:hypothetical protein